MKNIKNLHLILSAIIVSAVGIFYASLPLKNSLEFIKIDLITNDLNNVFKAVTGLYLSLSTHLVLNFIFMYDRVFGCYFVYFYTNR